MVSLGVGGYLHRSDFTTHRREPSSWIGPLHADQAIRIGIRQRTEEDRVDEAEDGGVGADTERQREDRGERETGIAPQHAQRVADIPDERFDDGNPSLVADPFLGLFDTAELAERDAARIRLRQSAPQVIADTLVDVLPNLHVELSLDIRSTKQCLKPRTRGPPSIEDPHHRSIRRLHLPDK